MKVSEEVPEGEWLARGMSGVRVAGYDTPIGPEDKFYLGEAGRAITALLAARIVETGLINWNSTVKEVLFDTGVLYPYITDHYNDTLMDMFLYQANLPDANTFYYDSTLMDRMDAWCAGSNFGPGNNNTAMRKELAQLIFSVDWSYPEQP